MIEYMSTVILTGCGPEVYVTSNNTQQRLRHQTEEGVGRWERWGHSRRGEGLWVGVVRYGDSMEKERETERQRETEQEGKKETDGGKCMESVIL